MLAFAHRKPEPFFLDGPNGKLFAVHHPPHDENLGKGCFLYVQPLAEEMNRCRQMVSLQARRLAELGYGTLILDLFGTGDSYGDYQDGTWERWRADIKAGVDFLEHKGYSNLAFWGVRHGALLALDVASEMQSQRRLLLWQPTLNGRAALTQILRIQIAASIASKEKETTAELRQRLGDGETVELSGYQTSGELATALDSMHASKYFHLPDTKVLWFDVLTSKDQQAPKASATAKQDWAAAGTQVHYNTVVGPAFWQVWERVIAGDLIEQTCASIHLL